MKFFEFAAVLAAAFFSCGTSIVSRAQAPTPPPTVPKETIPGTQQTEPAGDSHHGQVIFSRSTDENGETETQSGPAKIPQTVSAPAAADAEREALTFTDFDMDVRLRTEAHQIAVRALLTVRNDGKAPLKNIPLQISSSLNWERIRVGGKDAEFQVATLNSDSDHTGQLHEAAVALAQPLAFGDSLQMDVTYSGAIPESAQRLLAIGTPEDVALHSDWDQIGSEFTGLRGFGNVVWYPVSSVPVILGDGARLFDEIGEHKLRLTGARFRLRLTVEFPGGKPPTVALINGHPAALTVTDWAAGADVAGVATAQVDGTTLGFESPSLFVAVRKAHAGTNLTAWTIPDNEVAVQSWTTAATDVTPFLQGWLGQHPRAELTLLDLPDAHDAPFETGAMLATSLHDGPPEQLEGILAHALTHAWMQSPRAWLSEGVAHFMGTLWIEKKQGRDQALSALEAGRQALALAEPGSPGESAGRPLAKAISPVYYRNKAAYVLWMLGDIAGDSALSAALRAYDPSQDAKGYGKDSGPGSFETLLEKAGTHHDLGWFFADWVDTDKGLPDLTIESVFPNQEPSGNWLVAVNLTNAGYAAAEVPVIVKSDLTSVIQRVRIPGRGKAVQRILIQGKPTEVQVNDGTVPESQASVHVTSLDNAAGLPPGPPPGSSQPH
jgi:hypothetical protein